jgi:hypothetical protein
MSTGQVADALDASVALDGATLRKRRIRRPGARGQVTIARRHEICEEFRIHFGTSIERTSLVRTLATDRRRETPAVDSTESVVRAHKHRSKGESARSSDDVKTH